MRRTYLQIQRLKVLCISPSQPPQQDCEPVSPLCHQMNSDLPARQAKLAGKAGSTGCSEGVPVLCSMRLAMCKLQALMEQTPNVAGICFPCQLRASYKLLMLYGNKSYIL